MASWRSVLCSFFVRVRVSFIPGNWNGFDYTTSSDIDANNHNHPITPNPMTLNP